LIESLNTIKKKREIPLKPAAVVYLEVNRKILSKPMFDHQNTGQNHNTKATDHFVLKIGAARHSETLIPYHNATRSHNTEDLDLNN
jgi:hypothetical protein